MPAPLHIGLVGCGRWGANILRDLRALDCRVSVVARSAESTTRARTGGADAIVDAVAALGAVDGVIVATPTVTHGAVTESLLARDVPIFVEKPLCADVVQARDLTGRAAGRLFVMDKWRYHHGVEALAAIAHSGELGAPLGVVTSREQWGSPHDDVDSVWIHVPHDLAIGLEILGSLPTARLAVAEVVDGGAIGLHGVLGQSPYLTVSHSSAVASSRRIVRLLCERGTATLPDSYDDAVLVSRGVPHRDRPPERRPIASGWPLLRELRAFVEHVRGGPPPRSTAEEHLVIVERLAALRSLAGLDGGELAA